MDLIEYAERLIWHQYGEQVSIWNRGKALNKFGRTANADTGVKTTVATFQGAVVNETFVSTNLIDSIVSDDAGDTQTITVAGMTIDASGNLAYVEQDIALTGQTEATLTTPLARADRAFVANSGTFDSPQAALAGNVYIYDNTDGITAGVPDTAAATKLMIEAGKTQTEKCAVSIGANEYWVITGCSANVTGGGPSSDADFEIEYRDVFNGGVWRPMGIELTLNDSSSPQGFRQFMPYRVIPKNHDARMVVTTTALNTEATADIQGYLAIVRG